MTAPDSIDTVLRSDHAAIRRDLADVRGNRDVRRAGELFGQLTADIVRHFVAEEQYLLPAVRDRVADGETLATASFSEHQHIERLLKDVDDDDTTDERIGEKLAELSTAFEEHIRVQESDVLPALVGASNADQLAELGEGVLGAEQLAPTHPRSFVPKSATVSKITSWLTGLVERSVDSRERHDEE